MRRAILLISVLMLCVWAVPCWAQEGLSFPADCDTATERLEYTCRAQERLRYLHNAFVKWTEKGLTQKEYDEGVAISADDGILRVTIIPDKLKALYPYEEGMTVAKMQDYIAKEHKPRQRVISESLGTQRALVEDEMQTLTKWDVDIQVGDIPTKEIKAISR